MTKTYEQEEDVAFEQEPNNNDGPFATILFLIAVLGTYVTGDLDGIPSLISGVITFGLWCWLLGLDPSDARIDDKDKF